MNRKALILVLLVSAAAWPSPSMSQGGDWYLHRTSQQITVPPGYCYCYRVTNTNVIPNTPTHPILMQVTREVAMSRLAKFTAMADTCPGNCAIGSGAAGKPAPPMSQRGDWYLHRTSQQMTVPPGYCYCYRVTKTNVIPNTPTHPIHMQVTREVAMSELAKYTAMADTCPGNCAGGSGAAGQPGPRADLSGRWQVADKTIYYDFVAVPGGRSFSAGKDGFIRCMLTMLANGRVRAIVFGDGRLPVYEGKLSSQVRDGRPADVVVLEPLAKARREGFRPFTLIRMR